MEQQEYVIRLANDADFEDIYSIWFDGISNSFNVETIYIESIKEKFKINFLNREGIFNYWVVDDAGSILGFSSLNKCTVNPIKENKFAEYSIYLKSTLRKIRLGDFLLNYVIDQAKNAELQYVIAYISSTNESVIKLAKDTDWIFMGELPENTKSNLFQKILILKAL